jgi:hypothetical protein
LLCSLLQQLKFSKTQKNNWGIKMKKFINWLKSPSSDFALFIVFLLLLNIVSYNSFFRLDLTQPKSYSLSKPSKQVVKNLQEPLTIRVFFDKNLPTPYNSVAQYVEDLLAEYDGVANKNFSVINMDLSKEESLAMASDYGLSQIQIQEIKNNEVGFKQVYMGLVLSYGDSIETLDSAILEIRSVLNGKEVGIPEMPPMEPVMEEPAEEEVEEEVEDVEEIDFDDEAALDLFGEE